MLQISNITKRFGQKVVLQDVSLMVPRGDIAVLLGASGVGKSTLLRVLNYLEPCDSGTVFLDGIPLDLATVNRTHTVGMVFQNFNLFEHISVEENITLALEKVVGIDQGIARIQARDLLKRYNLLDKATASVVSLSGGQKQRLALARTLALKPTIVCLDEPTSALDPLLTTHVAHTIQELAQQGYIVVVATHDIALLEKLTCTIYLMEAGTIAETASSSKFRMQPTLYPRLTKFVTGSLEE